MEERSICLRAPLLAEADTENNMNSITKVSSVADADTVINTNNTNSSQTKGDRGEGELLEELLTDSYCHVCEAVLLFESQRLSHYEGKRHAQKLRMYLQAKRDEKRNKDPTGLQRSMTTDKDRFCELCSMVFSSPVVARSHYEGKVHAKNLRRHGLPPSTPPADVPSQNGPQMTLPAPTNPIPVASNPKPSEEEVHKGPPQDPPASTDVDLSDPDRHCRLCAASFNNPVMALQHYNGRKHQRNHARQRLLQELGDDHVQANHFSCPICSIELNSVEMYQAHMQGNKHQVKEKKVVDLCKSQKKTYDSFTDELADYIQVQKARGLSPKTGRGPNEADEHDQGEDEEEADDGRGDGGPELSAAPPTAAPHPASLYPPAGWRPLYQAPPTAAFGFAGNALAWAHAFPPLPPQPLLPGHTPPRLPGRPPLRRRRRDSSSSSYSSSSSSSSSYTSSSSDSDHRHRKRKRTKSRRERGRKSAREEEDGDQEETRRRRRGRGVRDDSEGRRGREEDEEEDGRRKRQGKSGGRGEKRPQEGEEEEEEDGARRAGRGGGGGEETEEKKEEDSGPSRPKHRREKRKTREKVDTRTEEEKLWDESILGL